MGPGQERAGAADHLWWPLYRSGPECRPLLSERRPHARLRASRDRAAARPQIAAAGRELSSVMVGAVGAAAGAVQRAGRSAAGDLCAANRQWPLRRAAGPTQAKDSLLASKKLFKKPTPKNNTHRRE